MSNDLALDGTPPDPAVETRPTPPRRRVDWWGEAKGVFWLLLAVLGFHSFIAKPFYIPSESMLSGLEVGDRLVVNKFTYGWSFVSPTIPNPAALFRQFVLREPQESWSVQLPFRPGRVWGRLPERGDVVIVTPPGTNNDYIKRVIGLPGDHLAVHQGVVSINGRAIRRGALHYVSMPVDANTTCNPVDYPGSLSTGADGRSVCRLPVVTETLTDGRHWDTVDVGETQADEYPRDARDYVVPANHVFLMGDNRDHSADSRFPQSEQGLGGAVPWENIGGRAEFITFSLDGTTGLDPLTWFSSFRHGRAGTSLHPEQAK